MKTLACADLVPGCPAVVEAETDDEIVQMAAQHAIEVHGLTPDDDLVAKVRASIRSEEAYQ